MTNCRYMGNLCTATKSIRDKTLYCEDIKRSRDCDTRERIEDSLTKFLKQNRYRLMRDD